MAVRKLANSWQYDFKLPGYRRERKGGFRTKAEALLAEKAAREALLLGSRRMLFGEGFDEYMASTRMKDRTRDSFNDLWRRGKPVLGHLYVEEVDTPALDRLKRALPKHLGPKSVNQHLILIRAVLRFLWKRGRIRSVPYVPMESVPRARVDWYTKEERDQLLDGMFRLEPQWYLFYYFTARLGLRTGEVYAISYRQIVRKPMKLIVDQAVQRGTKTRPARLSSRKNEEVYELGLTADILAAVDWHIEQGYAGEEFLFSKTGVFPRYIDSHVKPLKFVQRKLGLRMLSHHKVGRHSVASQAVTGGESIKAVQAQLGHVSEQSTHKYAHLGSNAQLRLVTALKPERAPHEKPLSDPHVNLVSTAAVSAASGLNEETPKEL